MTEVASICSVPIDFIVMRGQGIKLLSFIAKKCREKNTLMPVIEKAENDGSYEGAICLAPKKGFYTEDPVAVVDYASLYPSSMISENISHDSKVWTKEYDLEGNIVYEKDQDGNDKIDENGNKIYGRPFSEVNTLSSSKHSSYGLVLTKATMAWLKYEKKDIFQYMYFYHNISLFAYDRAYFIKIEKKM